MNKTKQENAPLLRIRTGSILNNFDVISPYSLNLFSRYYFHFLFLLAFQRSLVYFLLFCAWENIFVKTIHFQWHCRPSVLQLMRTEKWLFPSKWALLNLHGFIRHSINLKETSSENKLKWKLLQGQVFAFRIDTFSPNIF